MQFVRNSAVNTALLLGGRRCEPLVAAKAAGLTVIYCGPRNSVTPRHLELADLVITHESSDLTLSLIEAAHRAWTIDLAVPVTDEFVALAADVNRMFGLGKNSSESFEATRDKNYMRHLLQRQRSTVRSQTVSSYPDLLACPEAVGLPGILKPATGTASNDVHLIECADDLRAFEDHWTDPPADSSWIYEEFVSGPEFSVETFTTDRTHHVLAITEKFKGVNFVEVGHLVPARLERERAAEIREVVAEVLTTLGIQEGPCHTEVIWSDQGARVVETHVRQGGDAIVELVRSATGIDLQELTFTWLSGRSVDLESIGEAGAAAIWFLTPEPGRVSNVLGTEAVALMPGVREVVVTVEPDDVIPDLTSSSARSGHVIAIGSSPDEALQRAQSAAAAVTVEYAPDDAAIGTPIWRNA